MAEGLTAMTTSTNSPARRVVLGPGVRLTHLLFGGAVLLNEKTLALAECTERDAAVIERLLSGEHPGPDDTDARRLTRDLLRSQWLVVTDEVK
jgi:hypothetical protein